MPILADDKIHPSGALTILKIWSMAQDVFAYQMDIDVGESAYLILTAIRISANDEIIRGGDVTMGCVILEHTQIANCAL